MAGGSDYITDEMWRLWLERPNKAWKLGGIYANKKAYHNTVNANLKHWPGNYSIVYPLDLVAFNRDKARAIDLTMSDSEMRRVTRLLKNSAEDPKDNRLAGLREFYGTLDSKNVFGLSKSTTTGPWHSSSADKTHLWHIHLSIFTAFVANWVVLLGILSVLKGETLQEWRREQIMLFPTKGSIGEPVKYWQHLHNKVRTMVKPTSPELKVDGEYGAATAAAFHDFWKKNGGAGTSYTGQSMTGWLAATYHEALAKKHGAGLDPPISDTKLNEMVNKWLEVNFADGMTISGKFEGKANI